MRGLQAIPDDLAFGAPAGQPLYAAGDEPEVTGHFFVQMSGGVDVEGNNVSAFHVFAIIFRMIGARAATVPVIPGYPLSQVQQYRTGRVIFPQLLISTDYLCRMNGRTVTFAFGKRLRVIRFVVLQPSD